MTDSSSGRKIVFNAGTGGYIGSVDAPENATTVHTHTALTWDANGHCTAINVYAGGTNTLLHSDVFGYGGPNGDSVTSEQQGVSVASFVYGADAQFLDPFGLATPRLLSATYGTSSDTSSSDDGGSVAGTYSYTYGPMAQGYNWWGVSARTNTTTDARGSLYKTLFQLAGDSYGGIIGLTEQGPTFTGATGANQTRTAFSPNMDNPQVITFFDQVFNAGQTLPWQAYLDLLGNLTSFSDPMGHTWQFVYSDDGKHLISATDPTNISASFAYGERNNPASLLTTASDPAGATTQIDYNSFGQPITVTSTAASGLAQSTLRYDSVTGDLTSITDPLGNIARITGYDALGDPLGAAVYPDTGNPTTSLHPLTTTVTYDAAQMPVTIAAPNGVNMQTTFTNGVATQLQLQNQGLALAQTTLAHDTRGRLYQANDAIGALIGYKYDKNSNVTRVLDGNGNGTQFVYGSNNELTSLIWPDGVHQATIAYDAAGRIRQTTDERGIVCNDVYDAAHRLTDMQFPNSSGDNAHYTYDIAGRLLTATDATGSRMYSYDTVKRLHQITTVLNGLPTGNNTFTVTYTYNSDSSVSSLVSPVGTTQYGYNAAGNLAQLTDPAGNATTWSYDHAGVLTGQVTTTPAGRSLSTTNTWGVSGLAGDPSSAPYYLRQISQASGSWTRTYTLTHSLLGQLLRQDLTSSQTGTSGYEQFGYDSRGRLNSESVSWQPDAQSNYNLNSSYGFDAANNVKPAGGNWSVNSSNQVTSAPAVSGSAGLLGATGLSYNAAGSTSALNGAALSYDVWGDLSDVTLPGGTTVHYVYDSSGRRVCKQVGSVKTFYLYNGSELLAETDGNGSIVRSYTWGITGLLCDRSGIGANAQTRLYAFDGLGNTRALIDGSTGTLLWQGAWSAWGLPQGTPSAATPFGYHGQTGAYLDGESGLLKMGCRYYAPCIGRFLTRDPSGWSNGANLYGFCLDDPVDFFDANGCEGNALTRLLGGALSNIPSGIPGESLGSLAEKARNPRQALHDLNPLRPLLDLPDAARAAGTAQGRYDSGKISGAELAAAYARYAAHLTEAALLLYSLGKMAVPEGCNGPKCFVAGTPVWVAWQDSKGTWHTGTKPVEQVKAGEYVIARNEQTGKTEYKKVLRTTIKQADVVVAVTLADAKTGEAKETITASREHPFYVDGKGFVPAGALAIGNSIVTRAGPVLVVKSVEWKRQTEGFSVYNFAVDDLHTYFVGNTLGGAWVHNVDCPQLDMFDEPASSAPTVHGDLRKNMLKAGPSPFPGAIAHHELPWGMRDDFFNRFGINVNDAEYGQWTNNVGHHAIHDTPGWEYNAKWAQWLADHPNATASDVQQVLDRIRSSRRYGSHYF